MHADRTNKWLTLGANLGVLAGIILVAFEINQASRTSNAEMIDSFQDRWIAMDMSWQDAEFAAAWAKAMDNPEELSLNADIFFGNEFAQSCWIDRYFRISSDAL